MGIHVINFMIPSLLLSMIVLAFLSYVELVEDRKGRRNRRISSRKVRKT